MTESSRSQPREPQPSVSEALAPEPAEPGPALSRRALLGGAAAGALGAALPLTATPAMGQTAAPAAATDAPALALNDTMATAKAWTDFLGGLDLVWARVPATFYEGPFLGNGGLGAAVYRRSGTRLSFTLGDSRVRDHQSAGGTNFGRARLPVGYLTLDTAGDVTGVDLRLSLRNAELSGTVTTSRGVLALRAYVHARRDVLVVSVTPRTGAERVAWTFTPLPARSPRLDFHPAPDGLLTNPDPTVTTTSGGGTCTQSLAAGGQTVTRWRTRSEPGSTAQTLLVTVAHSYPGTEAGTISAQTINAAAGTALDTLTDDHRSWWHAFYPKSFVSIPGGRLQSFYWIQLYKIASATRQDRPVISTIGPWLEKTPWPGVWWNLNVQLEYWLLYATGHTELDSLSASLDRYAANLRENTPPAYRGDSLVLARTSQEDLYSGSPALPGATTGTPEVGNLTWALHNAWLAYRHTMDDAVLRTLVFPLLRQAINFYLHFLTKDGSGTYHLPATFSPEYAATRDCNYDLALISWGCATLLAANRRLNLNDALAPTWQDVLDHLVRPPQDATQGMWIGADRQLTSSHRHYSHLLWFYPLYQLRVTSSTNRDLLRRSLTHWLSFTGALQGYTFTGSGSMYAVLGDGTRARAQLNTLLDRYVKPNTMYAEAGPVIETPLSGAQSMHDMLCQSWGGVIRIFPAVPDVWQDVTIHEFRTEGAFLVSAARKAGRTEFVRVHSLAGEPCRVRPGIAGRLVVCGWHGELEWRDLGNGTIEIELDRDQEAVIYAAGTRPDFVIAPVPIGQPAPRWGLPALPPPGSVVPVDISTYFNNDAITSEFYMGDGDFDGTGRTYPSAQLPQTGRLTDDDIPFLFTNGGEGTTNNVVAAGQTIALPAGRYARLHLLGASDNGNTDATATAAYADGSTATVPLRLTDWSAKAAFDETEAIRTSQLHTRTGPQALQTAIFHQSIDLDPGRELRSITLPTQTKPRSHVFAVSLEKPKG
jgi:hypothetical protein